MLNLVELFKKYDIATEGVICVGAHIGQDMFLYDAMGFKRAVMIEADEQLAGVMHTLSKLGSFANLKKTYVVQGVISDHDGEETFYKLAGNRGLSSSILKPKEHLVRFPNNHVAEEKKVSCARLDGLVRGFELASMTNPFNFLHLDIQGAEMKALQGAEWLLKIIDAISSEVNHVEMYEGCTLEPEFTAWLDARDFDKVDEVRGGMNHEEPWGDAFYVRRK